MSTARRILLLVVLANMVCAGDCFALGQVQSLVTGNAPIGAVCNPITNKFYVLNQGARSISIIDGVSVTESSIQPFANNETPMFIMVDPEVNRYYVVFQEDLGGGIS